MKKETYELLENYMISCMEDSAHDKEHIYRVLFHALEIAQEERDVDCDVLIAACLLHDIARKEQFEDPSLCHALVGGEKAYIFMVNHGFEPAFAEQVKHCIQTHRCRKSLQPESIEAKILFDADKLDATGAMGIARTLMFKADGKQGIYSKLPNGEVSDGCEDTESTSFFREYKFKLEKLYDKFYTEKAAQMARQRQKIAADFYEGLLAEVRGAYGFGRATLQEHLQEDEI